MEQIITIAFLTVLAAIAWTDYKTMKIPDRLVGIVLLIAALSVFVMPRPGIGARIWGSLAISLPMLCLAILRPGSFGGGDIKLMAAGGLFLGAELSLLSFVIAVLGSGFYGLLLLLFGKADRKGRFPLGPFLCAGMALSGYFGEWLWPLFTF